MSAGRPTPAEDGHVFQLCRRYSAKDIELLVQRAARDESEATSTAAFAEQPGLPTSPAERDRLAEPCPRAPWLYRADRQPRLAGPMLMMIDRITGYWPDAGPAGLGRLRAEKDVDPGAWFFKAHFFQDPVMPGSPGSSRSP